MPLPERDIHHFIEITLSYLNKMTGNEIVLRDPTIEFQSLVFSAYTGLIHLQGSAEGFVYVTASQPFLQQLSHSRSTIRHRLTDEACQDVLSDITHALVNNVRKRFGPSLRLSEPRLFSTVPDDPIEMPPAVFVQPFAWRKETAYFVLGLNTVTQRRVSP